MSEQTHSFYRYIRPVDAVDIHDASEHPVDYHPFGGATLLVTCDNVSKPRNERVHHVNFALTNKLDRFEKQTGKDEVARHVQEGQVPLTVKFKDDDEDIRRATLRVLQEKEASEGLNPNERLLKEKITMSLVSVAVAVRDAMVEDMIGMMGTPEELML